MTEKQQLAVAVAFTLLEQSFDHVVLVVDMRERDGVPMPDEPVMAWSGGRRAAKDIIGTVLKRLEHRSAVRQPPKVDPAVADEAMAFVQKWAAKNGPK